MSEPGNGEVDGNDVREPGDDSLRSLLRGALRESGPLPDVLSGVQRKIRERSRGKFYADGWSTAKHAPGGTYLVTSLIMLAVLIAVYALISPLSGKATPVHNTPEPVQLIPNPVPR